MGTRNWPVLIPIPRKYSLADAPWVAKNPVLSVARGNARTGAKKNLESQMRGRRNAGGWYDVELEIELNFWIGFFNRFYVLLLTWLTRENCYCTRLMRGVISLELFGKYWEWESAYCLINCIFSNQISEMGISCTISSLMGNFKFIWINKSKTSLIF